MKNRLQNFYLNYIKSRKKHGSNKKIFFAAIPEIIYRSTRLEGERVSRKKILSLT